MKDTHSIILNLKLDSVPPKQSFVEELRQLLEDVPSEVSYEDIKYAALVEKHDINV